MQIKKIKITNFKSIYGTQEFDFEELKGLIKLSGSIGAGKTTIAEALLYGLYGNVKGQNINQLISWNRKFCEVEIDMVSRDKNIHIVRATNKPLIVLVNNVVLSSSNKRDTQEILESEVYDVPKIAILKMCLISFNMFNSLASMSAGETKQFLDDVFGFKVFTEYNDQITLEKKTLTNDSIRVQAVYDETKNTIDTLKKKKAAQIAEIKKTFNIDEYMSSKNSLIEEGKQKKSELNSIEKERDEKVNNITDEISKVSKLITQELTLGKAARKNYETFKSGICPTCGQTIDNDVVNTYKNELEEHQRLYTEYNNKKTELDIERSNIKNEYQIKIDYYNKQLNELRTRIRDIDEQIRIYENGKKLIDENFDELITDNEIKLKDLEQQLQQYDREIAEWNDMSELFGKTLRYNLLDTLIPHINKSINFFISRLEQNYTIKYDQEFKAHIFVDGYNKEIGYNNLSTGQRKSLDIAIIFGVLNNIISNVDFNILFLDELFSNMDANTRNIMLNLLNETISKEKSIFVVNHAEMQDDYFDHKIRVALQNKKIKSDIRDVDDVIIRASHYENVF